MLNDLTQYRKHLELVAQPSKKASVSRPEDLSPFREADFDRSGGLLPFQGAGHPPYHEYPQHNANTIPPFSRLIYLGNSPLKRRWTSDKYQISPSEHRKPTPNRTPIVGLE